MSSKRRLRRKSCDGKIRFHTIGGAYATIKALKHVNGARHPETLTAFPCRFCKGFHFGHRGIPSASASPIGAAS